MVLSPNSDFFRFFNDPTGQGREAAAAAARRRAACTAGSASAIIAMLDLIAALGLALAVEGILFAAFPGRDAARHVRGRA